MRACVIVVTALGGFALAFASALPALAATPVPSPGTSSGSSTISLTIPGTPSPAPSPTSGGGAPGTTAPPVPSDPSASNGKLKISPGQIRPGDTVTIIGHGFAAGEKVQLVLYPGAVVIGSFTARPSGELTAKYDTASSILTGTHVVEGTGWKSLTVENGTFLVEGHPGTGAGANTVVGWALASGGVLLGVSGLWVAGATGALPNIFVRGPQK